MTAKVYTNIITKEILSQKNFLFVDLFFTSTMYLEKREEKLFLKCIN